MPTLIIFPSTPIATGKYKLLTLTSTLLIMCNGMTSKGNTTAIEVGHYMTISTK